MSFLAKFSQLRKKPAAGNDARGSEQKRQSKSNESQEDPLRDESSLLPQKYVREEDPAIRRLKELRRKEQLKNAPKNKPAAPSRKRKDENSANTETKFRRKVGESLQSRKPVAPVKRTPLKKLSFDELMKEAEEKSKNPSTDPIDSTSRSKALQNNPPVRLQRPGFKSAARRDRKPLSTPKITKQKSPVESLQRLPAPRPSIAQPGAKLKRKLENLKKHRQTDRYRSSEEEDMDDFIEDDEEEQGFNRDEIWAMFNKGKKRRDFENDYESDDMEVNEMDIMEEEERATKMAKLEDKREEEWLKKHEQEKRRRILRS